MQRRGFTLIELLVVISIIAVLAGMLLPAIGAVRDSAKQSLCMNQQRQTMMAILTYADEADGMLPPAGAAIADGWPYTRWYTYLLVSGHLPVEWLTTPLTTPAPSWALPMRYPNPLTCPVYSPRPVSGLLAPPTFTLRWFTNVPGQPSHSVEGMSGAGMISLSRVNKKMPYLAETTIKTLVLPDIINPYSYWYNQTLAAGWVFPYLLHRGKTVATYPDGHVIAHTAAQLAAEDNVITALTPP